MWLMTPGVDVLDLPDEADVDPAGRRAARAAQQAAVVAGEPDGGLPVAADAQHDVGVELADEHHLRDLDRRLVGDAQPADELDRHVQALHVGGDVGAAAVDDDRVHADVLEQHDVARELLAQRRVVHRRAAVLDHHRRAVELADVGQRLEQGRDVAHQPAAHASCRVLRVDLHVVVAEVGEEQLGLRALARAASTS